MAEKKIKNQKSNLKDTNEKSKIEKDNAAKPVKVAAAKKTTTNGAKETKGTKVKKVVAESAVAATVAAVVPEKTSSKKEVSKSSLHIDIYDMNGKVTGTLTLPEGIFGVKVNKQLLAQAVRVYLANQRQGTRSTKTRGEVAGSTRKIYRQKGTGRARHGGIRAPIFVKGGIAHGPKPVDYSLAFPKKMKRAALFSALSARTQDKSIHIVEGLEKAEPKTKNVAIMLRQLGVENASKTLLVMPEDITTVHKAARNIEGVMVTAVNRLNTYDVLNTRTLLFMKDAIGAIEKVFGNK